MWAPFAQLLLDGSEAYWADYPWTQGSVSFDARVVQWDRIERSIPAQAGMAQHSNTRIRLADEDRGIRDLMGSYVFRRRTCKIYLATQGGPDILDTEPIFTGEVLRVRFGEAWVELELRDNLYGWMDEEFPALITPDVFTTFPITGPVFAPVLQGHLVAADGQGCVRLNHIGVMGDPPAYDRWVVACHEVWDVIAVYKRSPSEGQFSLVDPADYNVVTETATVYGIVITFTFLDFIGIAESPPTWFDDGTEVSIDVDGIDARGAWGPLPAVSGAVQRNPIDFYINMTFFFLAKQGRSDTSEIFDTDGIAFLRERCEPTGDNYILCDGAILAPITARQFHGQFLTSFEMYIHQQQGLFNNPGTITLGLLSDSGTGPTFSEIGNIAAGSFEEAVGEPSFNELMVHYCKNYRTEDFECQELHVNEEEQALIGSVAFPKAERDSIELAFVREVDTAAKSIARRLNFMSFGSYRQTFEVPLPGLANVLEPGKSAFITHRLGFQFGGYSTREVKILGVALDLGNLQARVETILREPIIALLIEDIIRVWYDTTGTLGAQQQYRIQPTGTIDDVNTVFVLPDIPNAGTEEIYVNGILQLLTRDYVIDDDTITFTRAPRADIYDNDSPPTLMTPGDVIEVWYDVPGTGNASRYWIIPTGAVDSSNADFELPETPITDSERVYVNQGLTMQIKGVDYEMSTSTTIHFLSGVPQTGDTIYVFYDISGTRTRHRFRVKPTGRIDGVNVTFRLPDNVTASTERIFVNSVLQFPTADYAFATAKAFDFTTAPTRS